MYKQTDKERFKPTKRVALDGKIWWCVWDRLKQAFSSFVCHGKYRTKGDCEIYIAYYNKAWNLPHILN